MQETEISEFEDRLGYRFKDRKILLEALTHRSFAHENPREAAAYNERIEFLGDAILGFVIAEHLFLSEKSPTESIMAKSKSYLVKEAVLSDVARSISLGDYLRLGKGEEGTGGRSKPSLLADATEAVIGAVYLDGGFGVVRELILSLFREKIDEIMASGQFHDFKTDLQEKTQMHFGVVPEYRIIKEEGEEHRKTFEVDVFVGNERYGRGTGRSKKEAETRAAREALQKMPSL
jgi:ribonuclease III